MAEVSLEKVSKQFGEVVAVDDVTLGIDDRELLVLVGPSGCGKTTTLRMIAGLEKASSGIIRIGGRVVNRISPAGRNVAMVFQNFALYPHMTVYQNIAFPLESERISRQERDQRIMEVAKLLQIEELMDRKPRQISGGQQQRVGLGRAIVRNPSVLLMDEPLSNLDAKLRVQMRTELKRLQRRLGTTTVYVTHDQLEAMTMGDRIVVMSNGVIKQVGTADDIYDRPVDVFVAGLIGSPTMNFFDCELSEIEGRLHLQGDNFTIPLPEVKAQSILGADLPQQARLIAGIRPENLKIKGGAPLNHDDHPLEAVVEVVEPLGSETLFEAAWGPHNRLMARADSSLVPKEGECIEIFIDTRKIHIFDASTEKRIT
jgi:multiple sugar transport system ATP-binding protein